MPPEAPAIPEVFSRVEEAVAGITNLIITRIDPRDKPLFIMIYCKSGRSGRLAR